MVVRIARSRKQPTLHSYYLSHFSSDTLLQLKNSKPFATYHKDLQEYEVPKEVYDKLTEFKAQVIDQRESYPVFQRKHEGKYGYQEDAVEFARLTDNVLINFPQGMGKSLTTMKIIDEQRPDKTLIICGQSNLQEEWLKDAYKHDMMAKLEMRIVGGDSGATTAKKLRWLDANMGESGVDIINIEALRNDYIVAKLQAKQYSLLVVDEVQSAKGWKAEQTQGLHELSRFEGQKRLALSGTPVLNDPLEFFSLLKFFGQLKDVARTTFEKYYGVWQFDYWGHYVCTGYKHQDELIELVRPTLCYVDKGELGLPKKTRKMIELSWEDNSRYLELSNIYKLPITRLKKAGYSTKPQVKAEMQYLSSTASCKLEFIRSLAKTQRVLVFSQYTTALDQYRQNLAGFKVLYYHGKLTMKERIDVLYKWRTENYDILLLSIMSARYGLNLTEATSAVFVDIPPSMAVLEQAEDRTHRIGQTKPVTSYLLCASDLDRDSLSLIADKQEELDNLNCLR